LSGTTGTQIVPAQFFFQQLLSMNNPDASFDVCFGRIAPTSLTHRFEKRAVLRNDPDDSVAWDTSCSSSSFSNTTECDVPFTTNQEAGGSLEFQKFETSEW